MSTPTSFTLDTPTILCLAFSLSFMPLAFLLSRTLIPSHKPRDRLLFFWHAYDALTHLFIEGSFLYECFFSYATVAGIHNNEPFFLSRPDRIYGPAYGTGPSARLWQEYAKADKRWAGADLTVVSLELLTVCLGGPAAVYICYQLWQGSRATMTTEKRGSAKAVMWLLATALATAELYGGWMTFAPEWLTGSSQLVTHDPVYLWLYLVFFNTLWVLVPLWVLREAATEMRGAFVAAEMGSGRKNK